MSSTPIVQIELPVRTLRTLAELGNLDNQRLLGAVARGLNLATAQTASDIQEKRLNGEGPFPVDEGRLGVRSGRLRQSVRSVPATISGNTVTSGIGSNVAYAGIHEFGGTINRTVKAGSVRLRTNRDGTLLKRGDLATFAKATHRSVRTVNYQGGKEYTITIPARAPFGHGVAENEDLFVREITTAVAAELDNGAA